MKGYSFWICAGVGSGLLWGMNNLLISLGYSAPEAFSLFEQLDARESESVVPLVIAAINDISAAIALLCVYGSQRKVWRSIAGHLLSKEGAALMVAALLGGPAGQFLYCMGIVKAGSAYTLAITALYPIIGCVLARFFLRQFINRRMWCGIFLSVAGAFVVSYAPFSDGTEVWEGILFSFGAAVCWGSEIVLAVRGMRTILPEAAITVRETVSGMILGCIVLWIGGDASGIVLCHADIVKWFVCAGVAAGFSYALWYATNHQIGCARGTAMNSTFIVWGVLLQFLFGGGSEITVQTCSGCLLVLIGVVLTVIHPEELWISTKTRD